MRSTLLITFLILSQVAFAQKDTPPLRTFAFYTGKGQEITFEQAIDKIAPSDVVLFGEIHNCTLMHWFELRTIKALEAKNKKLVLGGEFFEKDDQNKIDEYLSGWIDEEHFEDAARFWLNYQTDYKPILELAHDSVIPFIATNVPRRYAAIVAKSGLDTLKFLPLEAKQYMPNLPLFFTTKTPGYNEMLSMMGEHEGDVSVQNIVKAQALKDATMAQSIAENLFRGDLFFHVNGDFHSANYGGIYWYLKRINNDLKISTIKVYSNNTLNFEDDWKNSGDIILVVPEDFPTSY